MQIILQATHGIVSGSPDFFKEAFGESPEEYEDLLLRPQHFLFNRHWYQHHGGRAEFEQFQHQFRRLNDTDRKELSSLLSSTTPGSYSGLIGKADSRDVNRILSYYVPLPDETERNIWNAMKSLKSTTPSEKISMPEDERVEDAGLTENI